VVSARVFALLLTSPRLRRLLLPQDPLASPYEVLEYDATLILHDPKGLRATFARRQAVRFLQDGVAAILDHFWGDGVLLTAYHHGAGKVADSFADAGRRHLVIRLRRPMRRGETLAFTVSRRALVGFTQNREWLETAIDHPIRRLRQRILFPRERPCRRAALHYAGVRVPLPVVRLADGRTLVRYALPQARADTPYLVRWAW